MVNDDSCGSAEEMRASRQRPAAVVVALWCAGLALAGCGTTRAVAREQRLRDAPATHEARLARAQRPPRAVAAAARSPVAGGAEVLVTPDGGAYVVLAAGPADISSRRGWCVAYLAASDRRAVDARGAAERLVAAADALFRAQQPVAELAGAELFSVVAVFGAPGGDGVVRELTYSRGPDRWARSDEPFAGEVSPMPQLPPSFERDPLAEASAVAVAREFLAHCDRGESDAAWALSSTALRNTMTRATFEQQLRASTRPRTGSRREVFHGFRLAAFAPGTVLEVLFERAGAFEAVQLRMDDDLEWRVSAVGGFGGAAAPAGGQVEL